MLFLISATSALLLAKGPSAVPPPRAAQPAVVVQSFQHSSVEEVAAAFNRLHVRPRFVFVGSAGRKRFDGTVRVSDLSSVMGILATYDDLKWDLSADVVTVWETGGIVKTKSHRP